MLAVAQFIGDLVNLTLLYVKFILHYEMFVLRLC